MSAAKTGPQTGRSLSLDEALALAQTHQRAGRLDAAAGIYRRILAAAPDQPDSLHYLGLIAYARGRLDEALALVDRSLAQAPQEPGFLNNRSLILRAAGRNAEAAEACRQALARDPGFAEAHYSLGLALAAGGDIDGAIAAYEQAGSLRPGHAATWNNLGLALKAQERLEAALAAFDRALAAKPAMAEALSHRAVVLAGLGRVEEAIAGAGAAVREAPKAAPLHGNLANVLAAAGDAEAAVTAAREAVRLAPDLASAHYNLALYLLLLGRYEEGWREHEWRWRVPGFPSPRRDFPVPQWDGGSFAGKRLLLHAEQGLGDTLQMLRFVPEVAARGGEILIEVDRRLLPLVGSQPWPWRTIAAGDPLPRFDLHCPLMSLPLACGLRLDQLPGPVPYLAADSRATEAWRRRLGAEPGLTVGLAWAGNPAHGNDRQRSLPFERLSPLLSLPGLRFVSLQVGPRAADLAGLPQAAAILDVSAELTDFAATAALVQSLDLVIAVDTAIVHLAGALGHPAWVLLAHAPDWRWLKDRSDSPWYPSLRLFRQRQPGDWEGVIAEVAVALAERASTV